MLMMKNELGNKLFENEPDIDIGSKALKNKMLFESCHRPKGEKNVRSTVTIDISTATTTRTTARKIT